MAPSSLAQLSSNPSKQHAYITGRYGGRSSGAAVADDAAAVTLVQAKGRHGSAVTARTQASDASIIDTNRMPAAQSSKRPTAARRQPHGQTQLHEARANDRLLSCRTTSEYFMLR